MESRVSSQVNCPIRRLSTFISLDTNDLFTHRDNPEQSGLALVISKAQCQSDHFVQLSEEVGPLMVFTIKALCVCLHCCVSV